ncbi:MAG TPA: sigma-70 family RNA polymerase sigma factor [Polyangiaceae bacterium]
MPEDEKAITSTGTGVSASASSVRLWYLVAVERSSALSPDDESRIRAELVGARRRCAELIARSPNLVGLVTEMVVEAKQDARAREWFRHAQYRSSLDVILQLVTEAERLHKDLTTTVPSAADLEGLTDRIGRLRISLAGITELTSRAIDRRSVGAALTDELAAWRDQLKQCRNELIDKHLNLVLSELRRMPRFGADKRELLQEGNLGLIRAAELFDERGDVPFVAYSLSWIRAYMRRLIETKRGAVALPNDVAEQLRRLRQQGIVIDQATGQAATIAQLAQATELEVREVRRLMLVRGLAFEVMPSDTPPSRPPSEHSDAEAVSALDALIELELIRTVGDALRSLNEREAQVISERYGFRQASVTSRPIIAKKLGVSAERVRQIENAALAKIAKALSDVGVSAEEVGALVFNASPV